MRQVNTLDANDAERAINAIAETLRKRGKSAVIAIADMNGELIALRRLDDAPLASILIAMNKAWTAARERKTTRDIGQAARDPVSGYDIAYYGDSRYTGWGGGVPVKIGQEIVGAVAVSGLPELEDMELAELGVQAILGG